MSTAREQILARSAAGSEGWAWLIYDGLEWSPADPPLVAPCRACGAMRPISLAQAVGRAAPLSGAAPCPLPGVERVETLLGARWRGPDGLGLCLLEPCLACRRPLFLAAGELQPGRYRAWILGERSGC